MVRHGTAPHVALSDQSLCLHQDSIFVQLTVPSYQLSSYGRQALFIAGPMTWKLLARRLARHVPQYTADFDRLLKLKHFFVQTTQVHRT